MYPFIGDQSSVDKIKVDFCLEVDVGKLASVSEPMIEFFESILNVKPQIIHKVIELILRYYETLIKPKNKEGNDKEKKYVAAKLLEYRQNCYKFLMNIQKTGQFSIEEKERAVEQIFAMSDALSNILVMFNSYSLAREVYKSINNA